MKVFVLIVVCILSSCKPLFAAWSALSLPEIPVWAGIQLIVGVCINLDAEPLMALVIVFKSSFLLISVFTAVKESVCIVILFHWRSLALLVWRSFQHPVQTADTRVPSLETSV